MSRQRLRDPNAPVDIDTPAGLPGAVRHFQERTSDQPSRGTIRHYTIGEDRIPFSEQQGFRGQHNAIVLGIGTYPEIAAELRTTDVPPARLAAAMRRLAATGRVPRGMEQHAQLLGRVTALMFGREGARDTRVVAYAPMTLDLIMRGEMTFHEAFAGYEHDPSRTGGRGAFPQSMRKASSGDSWAGR